MLDIHDFFHDSSMTYALGERTVCSCAESRDGYEVFLYQMLLLFNY
ncbi:hypothetical protein BIFCAT_00382 [Bifidobacterium catenulatum DSM 16992 = JCM 1194 = LMG 11043]|uniref:Uncharacterized protein n=1 Tax=Bifidobacterium catenulatum DSM 16992 = JCM 1194 = LMG 11043 TaxID=566552 RepID=B6XT73_9BIFI|nr:hypothetical protein BIFCAT_00382 [Bifidobacterium catenulatum DSM 16992 = JCM 1194 = LMG 11043]